MVYVDWGAMFVSPNSASLYKVDFSFSKVLMGHTIRDKQKMLNRVKRILGQMEGVRRSLEEDADCSDIMQRIVTARGSIDSLMAKVMEDHIRDHMIDPDRRPSSIESRAAQELIGVIKTYMR
jgi:DNA-binding FrmR family transcriptional regulator